MILLTNCRGTPIADLETQNSWRDVVLSSLRQLQYEVSRGLLKAGWQKIRDGEPVSCNECSRKCALTSEGLWGAEDQVRYAVCAACAELAACPLKGRYYC